MTIVAIHQPNYAPWLGYFQKMAMADVFVFLDDVQFSKQGYINRVRVLCPEGARWLTLPVKVTLGQSINEVRPAKLDWSRSHLDRLRDYYRKAPSFEQVWPNIEAMYAAVPHDDLAAINRSLIVDIAQSLNICPEIRLSSEIETGSAVSDDRLIRIVQEISPGATYLSGKGGAGYQDTEKFTAAGLGLRYTLFEPSEYLQNCEDFVAGLSVLDAVFHLGWDGARALIQP